MNIKKSLLAFTITSSLLLSPGATFAQTASPTAKANADQRIATLHTRCDDAIAQRLTSLNDAKTKINGLIKLSADQKAKFSGEIDADISGLNSLKAKCDADTDLATLQTDYRNVFLQFRIYAVFLPQMRILTASDTMDVTADKLADLANKLQSRIQSAGNPANLTTLLADMQAKISDAKTQYNNAQGLVTPLLPSNFNSDPTGTKTIETSARNDIKTGAQDLKTADQDAKQIYQALKAMHPSASATATSNPYLTRC